MEFGEGSVSCGVAEPACSHSLGRKISLSCPHFLLLLEEYFLLPTLMMKKKGRKDNKNWGACGGRREHLERKSVRPGLSLTESFLCLPEYFD